MSRRSAKQMRLDQIIQEREWTEQEVIAFNRRCHPDGIAKDKARQQIIQKHGFICSAIKKDSAKPQIYFFYCVRDAKGRFLCIETVHKLNMMIGFANSEDAKKWALKIPGGYVWATSEFPDSTINGANVEARDTNLSELVNPIANYMARAMK